MKKVVFVLFTVLLISCDNNQNQTVEFNNDFELVNTKSLIIHLDSTQGFFNQSFSQFSSETRNILSLLNKQTGVISLYDISTGKRIKRINLNVNEGPNGIGINIQQLTHKFLSHDSLIIHNGWTQKTFLLNSQGDVIKRYNFTESKSFETEGPFDITSTNDNQILNQGSKIFFNVRYRPDDYKNRKIQLILDLESGEYNLTTSVSDEFAKYCWGSSFSLSTLSTYNVDEECFVFSYGTDDNLYKVVNGKEIYRNPVPSRYAELEYFSHNPADYLNQTNYQKRSIHSQIKPKYYKILYLNEPKIYLREVFLERTEEDLTRGVSGLLKSMIITDRNFKVLGEQKFPVKKYFTSNYFTDSKGIYVADYEYYNNSEDSLKFDFYEPLEIKK